MSILTPEPRSIVRLAFDVTSAPSMPEAAANKVDRIVQILRGENVIEEIREKSIERYANYIETSKQESGVTETVLRHGRRFGSDGIKSDDAASLAFQNGMFELIDLFVLRGIWDKHSTLYSGKGLRYDYGTGALNKQMEDVRERGEITQAQQTSDLWACGCGSAGLHFSTVGDDLVADPYAVSRVEHAHGPTVMEDGKRRPTNTDRLDEAFAVAICKQILSGDNKRWLTFFGESDLFPDGRLCMYDAQHWHQIPGMEWGDIQKYSPSKDVLDKTKGGAWESNAKLDTLANPFTVHRKTLGAKDSRTPEYPISIPRGHSASGLAPLANLDLLDITTEFGVAASVILGSSLESAAGKRILTRGANDRGNISETIWARMSALYPGQDMKEIGWSASNSKEAMVVVKEQIRLVADNHSTPGFLVAPDWSSWPSGEALSQARIDLTTYRDKRIGFNRAVQKRNWQIMRALINISASTIAVADSVVETWYPGILPWPEKPIDVATEATLLLDKGIFELSDAISKVQGFTTTEQLKNYLKDRKKFSETMKDKHAIEIGAKGAGKPAAPAGLAGQAKAGAFIKSGGPNDASTKEPGQAEQADAEAQPPGPKP